jgi:hypothetical protein
MRDSPLLVQTAVTQGAEIEQSGETPGCSRGAAASLPPPQRAQQRQRAQGSSLMSGGASGAAGAAGAGPSNLGRGPAAQREGSYRCAEPGRLTFP